MIELRTLGGLELRGAAVSRARAVLAQPKRLALLAYLAVESRGGCCRRDTLVTLFWPELNNAHARGALRQALSFLRKELGSKLFFSRSDEEIAIDPEALWCDAAAFEQSCIDTDLAAAMELYRGDLLMGLFVTDASPEFEQWLDAKREGLRASALRAANLLTQKCEKEGDLSRAEHWARRVTEIAPDDERGVRLLMEVLAVADDHAGAIRIFENFERRLARECELEPPADLRDLATSLRVEGARARAAGSGRDGVRPRQARSIAVLPFECLGNAQEDAHVADGMTEELVTALGQVKGLRVSSRSATLAFRGTRQDLRVLRRQLDVDVVVEGSVRHDANSLRVVARLIDLNDGFQLWNGTYERPSAEMFTVQEEIARAIAGALEPTFAAHEVPQARPRPTRDIEAYNLYLKGRFHWNKRPRDTTGGLEFFGRAIARDPAFALAHAALADAYNTLGSWEGGVLAPRDAFPKARAAALKALELDPSLAEAYTALGYTSTHYLWKFDEAESQLRRSLALNPAYPHTHHWYSHHLVAMGRFDESLQESERCLALEPLDIIINIHLAWHYWLAHQYEAGVEQALRTQELDPYDSRPPMFLGFLYGSMGRHGEAIAAHRTALERSDGSAVLLAALGHNYAVAGRRGEAMEVLRQLGSLSSHRYISSYEVAIIHTALNEIDLAFEWLDRAYEERSAWLPYLAREPRLDPIRADPRFDLLLAKVGVAPVIPQSSGR